MRELVHHDHLHAPEAQPATARGGGFQDELDDFAGVEVAADELEVGFVLLERHDGEVRVRHDGVADCRDAFEEVEGVGGGGAGEGLDEDYAGRGLGSGRVQALDADWHCSES